MTNLWNNFKSLKWYWKIVLCIPFILILIVLLVVWFYQKDINKDLVNKIRKQVDNISKKLGKEVKKSEDKIKKIEKQHQNNLNKQKEVNKSIENIKKEHNKNVEKIENTKLTVSSMSDMYSNLRDRAK
jgi:peptidoglycan hydrolase CwlO-like protein